MTKKKINKEMISEVVRMPLAALIPASYNPRKMSVEAYHGLGKSIDKFGMLIPLVWNKRTGNIIGGHQRYRYLMEKGETEADVVVVDLDDNDEVALNITLNNHAIRGDFTSDVVALLEKSEVQLGSAFNDVGLAELFQGMAKRFEKELKGKNKSQEPEKRNPPPSPSPPPVSDSPPNISSEPDAIITCPECQSRFKMRNNEVIFDIRTSASE